MKAASDVPLAGATARVDVSVVADFSALAPRRSEWNALVARSHTDTVFQTFEFHASWWQVFGAGARALVIVAEQDGALVGIAPLMVIERSFAGRKSRVVQFIGTRSFDYCDFMIERTRDDVLPLLLDRLAREFDVLQLRDVPDTSLTAEGVRRFFEARSLPTDLRVLYEAPTRIFNDPVADRQLANKKSLKRHYNHFRKSGTLEFRHYRSMGEVAPYLERFFEQHVGRRAGTDAPSLFLDARMREFFVTLARELSDTGWLLFTVVLHDERPIAMHYGFEYGDRIIWYKPAFEMDLAKHSPGEVLIKCLLEYALERGVRELDFTIGAEAFKYRFANHVRSNCAVRVHKSRTGYRLTGLMLDARAYIERFPTANRIARRLLARWRGGPWL